MHYRPEIAGTALLVFGLASSCPLLAGELAQFSGTICREAMTVPRAEPLSAFVERRVGGTAGLTFGGVDWVSATRQANPTLTDGPVPAGTRLTVVTPKIPDVPVRRNTVCAQNLVGTVVQASIEPTAAASTAVTSTSTSTPSPTALNDPGVAYAAFAQGQIRRGSEARAMQLQRPSLASNAGLRYASPLVEDAVLLPNAKMVNVFVQLKGGPLDGLTAYGDIVPTTRDEFEGQEFALGWSRLTLGWGFKHEFPSIGGRLDFAPRVGFWTVEATLPRKQDDGSLGANDFSFRRPSVGVEGGLGMDLLLSSSARVWAARDVSRSASKDAPAGAASQREGIDFFFPGPDFTIGGRAMRWVLLTYVMRDAVFLTTKEPAAADLVQGVKDTDDPEETYYALLYAGVGATLTF